MAQHSVFCRQLAEAHPKGKEKKKKKKKEKNHERKASQHKAVAGLDSAEANLAAESVEQQNTEDTGKQEGPVPAEPGGSPAEPAAESAAQCCQYSLPAGYATGEDAKADMPTGTEAQQKKTKKKKKRRSENAAAASHVEPAEDPQSSAAPFGTKKKKKSSKVCPLGLPGPLVMDLH